MEKSDLLKFYDLLEQCNDICIASHLNPDGDNLGSLSALYHYLLLLGKKVTWYGEDNVPDDFLFLPGIDKREKNINDAYELFITLDCADLNRLGKGQEIFKNSRYTVNIDHHKTNTNFAQINLVEEISSTGELLYQILEQGKLALNQNIATGLFTAISSDTGSFKYDSTTSDTFLAAGRLMDYGINLNMISVNLYQKRSLPKTKILIDAMEKVEYLCDGKIGIVEVPLSLIELHNGKPSDTEGIIEFLRDVDSVELAILLKERNQAVKVSIRTKSYINAIPLVTPFGGGGHVRAAGATIPGTLQEVKEKIKKIALEEFDHARNPNCK